MIPTFDKAPLNWTNTFDNKKSLPLMGSSTIDVDGDGVDEVFLACGVTQEDALFAYKDGKFVKSSFALPAKPNLFSTFGAVSFDLDMDNKVDLILTGDYGVLWYKNTGSGFEAKKIEVPLNDKSVATAVTFWGY